MRIKRNKGKEKLVDEQYKKFVAKRKNVKFVTKESTKPIKEKWGKP